MRGPQPEQKTDIIRQTVGNVKYKLHKFYINKTKTPIPSYFVIQALFTLDGSRKTESFLLKDGWF